MDPSADMAQLKVFLDPLYGGLLDEGRKIDPDIFRGDP
jgi:hypothetical protein